MVYFKKKSGSHVWLIKHQKNATEKGVLIATKTPNSHTTLHLDISLSKKSESSRPHSLSRPQHQHRRLPHHCGGSYVLDHDLRWGREDVVVGLGTSAEGLLICGIEFVDLRRVAHTC